MTDARPAFDDPDAEGIDGGEGGLGIHHNKLLAINMEQAGPLKLAFGSANFSSGLVLHHENWNFVEVQKNSYFAQKHICMIKAVKEYGQSKAKLRSGFSDCVSAIDYPEEQDVRLFFAPLEGKDAMDDLTDQIRKGAYVDLAAHRFSNRNLISSLFSFIQRVSPQALRLLFDDDMFWSVKDGRGFGNQDSNEARIVNSFIKEDVSPHYLQTEDRDRLLHHNKFVIVRDSAFRPRFLHTGAGNLTQSGFYRNFENFYQKKII